MKKDRQRQTDRQKRPDEPNPTIGKESERLDVGLKESADIDNPKGYDSAGHT